MSKVSVIIPTYNRSAMLRQAIHSVLAQTYRDFEVIVVDDGSTDDTRETVASIPDPRIRYIWQENQERSAARNNGVREANGELLAFLDSDDAWLPNNLAVQVKAMDRYPEAVLVYGLFVRMDDYFRLLAPFDLLNQSEEPVVQDCHSDIMDTCCLSTIALLLRRNAFEDAGGFDPRLSFSEDWDLWIRMSELGSFCSVRMPVAAIRMHASNSMNDIASLLKGDLAVIEKTAARRGAGFDRQSKARAELTAYSRHAAQAVSLNMAEAPDWIAAALVRSTTVHEVGDMARAFADFCVANGCSLDSYRAKARWMETSVRLVNSLGGSESRRVWLGSFWVAAMHAARAMGDNRLAAQAFLHLLACGGIAVADRGAISAAVRALLALVRHPLEENKRLPREQEIAPYLQWLRDTAPSQEPTQTGEVK